MQKVRSCAYVYIASTDYRLLVSDSISLPSRGSFHLSLTVLVHYRSHILFSLGGWSPQIQARFLVSDPTQETYANQYLGFRIRDCNPLRSTFSSGSSIQDICLSDLLEVGNMLLQPPRCNALTLDTP